MTYSLKFAAYLPRLKQVLRVGRALRDRAVRERGSSHAGCHRALIRRSAARGWRPPDACREPIGVVRRMRRRTMLLGSARPRRPISPRACCAFE